MYTCKLAKMRFTCLYRLVLWSRPIPAEVGLACKTTFTYNCMMFFTTLWGHVVSFPGSPLAPTMRGEPGNEARATCMLHECAHSRTRLVCLCFLHATNWLVSHFPLRDYKLTHETTSWLPETKSWYLLTWIYMYGNWPLEYTLKRPCSN